MPKLLATDLDRTLLPNGSQEYDGSLELFWKIRDRFVLAYVTGRSLGLVRQAMAQYRLPNPDYTIADVGTSIYLGREFLTDSEWAGTLSDRAPGWDTGRFMESLQNLGMRLQEPEKQTAHKLSYYVDYPWDMNAVKKARQIVRSLCRDAEVVYSLDETHNIGLLDILPKAATKLAAVEHVRRSLGLAKKDVIYCGDSGNDILPLTYGYCSILVRNAIPGVRVRVRKSWAGKKNAGSLQIINGPLGRLNGYYVSGIIIGLYRLGLIPAELLGLK